MHVETKVLSEELWSSLQSRYQPYQEDPKYLDDTCIYLHKERYVAAWTNNVTRFRHAATSRGKSSNSRLNTYLVTSMLDMSQGCKSIKVSIEGFLKNYRAKRASD